MSGKRTIIISIVMLFGGIAAIIGSLLVVSPKAVWFPAYEHAHFRMQLVVDGKDVNFGDNAFQNHYVATCSDELAGEPIHFHDNKNQIVHLHWKGLHGGSVLKNYGWNLIGGPDMLLGYRFDKLPLVQPVPIYGNVLPELPAGARMWVYTGDRAMHQLRDTNEFLTQDVEAFFGVTSNVNTNNTELSFWRSIFFARASAHAGHDHSKVTAPVAGPEHSEEELQRINNLLGNVVIFVQPHEPKPQEVVAQFHNLEPLTASTCGG